MGSDARPSGAAVLSWTKVSWTKVVKSPGRFGLKPPTPAASPSPFASGRLGPAATPASKNPRREQLLAQPDWSWSAMRDAMQSVIMTGLLFRPIVRHR